MAGFPDHGVLAPICTPFAVDGDVDLAALQGNIQRYNSSGLRGFVVAGSTGEAVFLDRDEKLRVMAAVRESAASGMALVAGTGAESVRETVRLTNLAAGLGYDAALVVTPHYYRGQMVRPETQTAFFQAVADGARIPVVIYNFPQMTGVDLSAEVVSGLAAHGNIAGVKESSAEIAKIESMIRGVPAGFPVFVGASAKYHASLCLGAAGGILAIANALPRSTMTIDQRYRAGDIAGSRAAQQRIVEAATVAPRYGLQGLKYAMDLKGFSGGLPRPPLLPLGAREKFEIDELFRNIDD
jgi:4-hydroxy-2-oxoglutarate aldolase